MIIKKSPNKTRSSGIGRCSLRIAYVALGVWLLPLSCFALGEEKGKPIIVNGDTVEYSTDGKEFIASGNAEVRYEGIILTCDRLKVNTLTKDALAEGNARLDEARGVIEGESISYNLDTKKGVILDADFRANPYFGRARKVNKLNENEFVAMRTYLTTCSHDKPHWRMKSGRNNPTTWPGKDAGLPL